LHPARSSSARTHPLPRPLPSSVLSLLTPRSRSHRGLPAAAAQGAGDDGESSSTPPAHAPPRTHPLQRPLPSTVGLLSCPDAVGGSGSFGEGCPLGGPWWDWEPVLSSSRIREEPPLRCLLLGSELTPQASPGRWRPRWGAASSPCATSSPAATTSPGATATSSPMDPENGTNTSGADVRDQGS
ncbi:unnamed protein product, partial [Urochloa humidicola]